MQFLEKIETLIVEKGEKLLITEKQLAEKTTIIVQEGASLIHYKVHQGVHHSLDLTLEKNAIYQSVILHIGSGDLNAVCNLNGENAVCQMDMAYVAKGDDVSLLKTDVRHNASDTKSSQLIKGAVNDKAKVSFEGRILIPYGQKAIDGSQQHRALLLSKDAEIKAVPFLEIYADDVKCAHGSAIGMLNQQQLYYLRTRGIDEAEAKQMLTVAFLNEALDSISDENVRNDFINLSQKGLTHDV